MDNKSKGISTALLVMDMHNAILVGRMPASREMDKLVYAVESAITAARAAGIPVIYVVLGFREGCPEVSPNNKMFEALLKSDGHGLFGPPVFHPSIAPKPGDLVITKKRVSAFSGNDLEMILRSRGIDRLVLTGIATGGIVLSTIREASDKDYHLSVLSDGCADRDPEVHTVLLTKVFPRQAEVLTAAAWAGSLTKG